MDMIMESLLNATLRFQKEGKLRLYSIIILLIGLFVAIGGSFIKIEIINVTLGCLAGVGIFASGYMFWFQLPSGLYDKLDLRGNWPIIKRRWMVAWTTLFWFLIVGFGAHYLPKSLAGALNVAVLLTLWRIVGLTKLERALEIEEAKISSKWPVDEELNTDQNKE